MYSNFSALKTNMAIYLSPFQRHLTATLLYTWHSGEKITTSPPLPPPKPRPYKALAVNGAQR